MLDIRAIRERPEFFRDELAKVGYGAEDLSALLASDERRRRLIHDVERRRAERAKGSREIGKIADASVRTAAVVEMKRQGRSWPGSRGSGWRGSGVRAFESQVPTFDIRRFRSDGTSATTAW